MKLSSRTAASLVAIALSCVTAAAGAVQIEGVRFAPEIEARGRTLVLNGYALLRYKVLWKAYVAALYLEAGTPGERALADVPKRLEIEYFWGISAADFARATVDGIAANLPPARLAKVRQEIDMFNRLYVDVSPGDRYSLSYLPGVGTELALNGDPLGSVPGREFAAAMFSIWLGDRPLDSGLKAALLGD